MSFAAECRWCTDRHGARFLCDPAQRILEALYARGMEGNMPTLEFPEPIVDASLRLGLNEEDRLLRHIVVEAATVPVAGVPRPMLIFTGRDVYDVVLPRWAYAGQPGDIRRVVRLVEDMANLAITRAGQGQDESGRSGR